MIDYKIEIMRERFNDNRCLEYMNDDELLVDNINNSSVYFTDDDEIILFNIIDGDFNERALFEMVFMAELFYKHYEKMAGSP